MKDQKVLIDLERLKYRNTGLGEYSYQLGSALKKVDSSDSFYYLLPKNNSNWFDKWPRHELAGLKRKFCPLFCSKYDLWHATHQDSSYAPGNGEKYLLTIHDLNFLGEKSEQKIKQRLARLQKKIDRASHVTMISEYTKLQVEKHLDLKTESSVIYNGVNMSWDEPEKPSFIEEKSHPFLFTLGVVRPKKNFHVLIEFLSILPEEYSLVIAGNQDHEYYGQIQKLIKEHKVESRVSLPGEVSGGVKTWLYQNCAAFVFPSLLEGFGFPVIEAQYWGQPIFTSNRTCLPEVAGPEAYVWESFDPGEMKEIFERGMAEFVKDSEKSQREKEYAAQFTWEKAASAYISVYDQLLR